MVVVGKWMMLETGWMAVCAGGLWRIIHRLQGGLEETEVDVVGSGVA
jgi:hypothetical protein